MKKSENNRKNRKNSILPLMKNAQRTKQGSRYETVPDQQRDDIITDTLQYRLMLRASG